MKTKLILAVLCAAMIGSSAFGAEPKAESSEGQGIRFGAIGGVDLGIGQFRNKTKTIPFRNMSMLAIHAMPGVRISDFLVGVMGEYRFVGQSTDPVEVGNQNLKGNGFLMGVGTAYTCNRWQILGGLDFIGKYSLSKNDPLGNKSSFSKPLGFRIGVGYEFMERISANLLLQAVSYSNNTLGGTDSDISENKLTENNLRVGVSYRY